MKGFSEHLEELYCDFSLIYSLTQKRKFGLQKDKNIHF